MIELVGVSFAWGTRTLFSDLDLVLEPGLVHAVLGPNGAGKSTLLRLALGLAEPTRGRVIVSGDDLRSLARPQIARRMAALLQDEPAMFPMTALECVLLGRMPHLRAHGFESADDLRAAESAMNDVGVTALADRLLETLSGGERRRVLLARTFAQAAPVLVLDEPAANLDLAHQLELFALLRDRARAGATVLASVHDLNLAARGCDRVVLLDGKGAVVAGAPSDVLTRSRIADVFGVDVKSGTTEDGAPYFVPLTVSR